MRNLRLTLSYDGTDFCGWQVQPGRPSVQQTLADALARICGETLVVHGSGRTDAGVHALEQVANVTLAASLPAANLRRALNAVLPASVRVLQVAEAAPDFHARRDALAKLYRYRLYRPEVCPPFLARYVCHWPYPLNEAAMIGAASAFEGRHDFTSFAARGELGARGAEREILRSQLERRDEELVYEVLGRGFLHHMVRNMVGFLLEIGRGQRDGSDIAAALAARDRRRGGATAPARGLALARVFYESADLEAWRSRRYDEARGR